MKWSPNGLGKSKYSPASLSTHLFNPLALISFFWALSRLLDNRNDSQKKEDKLPELSIGLGSKV